MHLQAAGAGLFLAAAAALGCWLVVRRRRLRRAAARRGHRLPFEPVEGMSIQLKSPPGTFAWLQELRAVQNSDVHPPSKNGKGPRGRGSGFGSLTSSARKARYSAELPESAGIEFDEIPSTWDACSDPGSPCSEGRV